MKLWLVKPRDYLVVKDNDYSTPWKHQSNPWYPWFDKVFGLVVAAESEDNARKIADSNGGGETGEIEVLIYRTGGHPWLDADMSTCECISSDYEGKEGVILRDKRNT